MTRRAELALLTSVAALSSGGQLTAEAARRPQTPTTITQMAAAILKHPDLQVEVIYPNDLLIAKPQADGQVIFASVHSDRMVHGQPDLNSINEVEVDLLNQNDVLHKYDFTRSGTHWQAFSLDTTVKPEVITEVTDQTAFVTYSLDLTLSGQTRQVVKENSHSPPAATHKFQVLAKTANHLLAQFGLL